MSTHLKPDQCPNCSTSLTTEDNFCRACGQANHSLRVPVRHLVADFVDSVFNFETKFFNTIKVLFTRPGWITRDFWEGKRARYMHPFRLYIFVSFLFFLIANKMTDEVSVQIATQVNASDSLYADHHTIISLKKLIANDSLISAHGVSAVEGILLQVPLSDTLRQRLYQHLRALPDRALDSLLATKRAMPTPKNRRLLRKAITLLPVTDSLPPYQLGLGYVTFHFRSLEELKAFETKVERYSDQQIDSVILANGNSVNWLSRKMTRQAGKIDIQSTTFWKEFFHLLLDNVSLIMFLLMPFMALLLLLIYGKCRRYYVEHLIFSIHIHTAVFILLSLALAIDFYTNAPPFIGYAMLVGWLYLLVSLEMVYRQGWPKTLFKFLLLSFGYFTVSLLCLAGSFLWGVIML